MIERANLDDASELSRLENEVFDKFNSPLSKRSFIYHARKNLLLVFRQNGEILGYILVFAYLKIPRIYSLAVSPKARGKGIGKALLAAVTAKFDTLRLEVRTDNQKAINLYESFGFKKGKILSGYYDDGCDGIEMKFSKITSKSALKETKRTKF
ncbi:GNAT family N-acetyltransferase [Campylobacter curvus]|jgi:ribosomal-protein-alanine acetyltransferase|uniref:GNAT family N-acetyltransferase n=1 Tax=Campylobacter curvus TaxID=200 RepID=UPI0014705E8A|nr:N-acetyltransferase [Campylobacter curvus]